MTMFYGATIVIISILAIRSNYVLVKLNENQGVIPGDIENKVVLPSEVYYPGIHIYIKINPTDRLIYTILQLLRATMIFYLFLCYLRSNLYWYHRFGRQMW